jgi:uncharacterized DUF497 family protein
MGLVMKSKIPGLSHMHSASTIRCLNTWDEAKRQQNLKDHGIDFADLDGFFDGDLLTREDVREAYGEVRYQSIGVFNGVPCSWLGRHAARKATSPI